MNTGTLVQQQKRNMAMIRQMGNQPYKISVYRQRKWVKIDTTDILPGDLCSVLRNNENNPLPCDMLLLRGQCIVDESMLTGESIPQMKEPIENVDENTIFDLERHGKLHVLSAGTRIVQHTPPAKMQSGMKSGDNGCIAYALRTGFSTSQGKLLKTILYSVKRVTANNLETFLFILFLLIFAVIAAGYVWIEGTKDPKRNRYKLFIECTLILTSVVPPELPIELSLAVNTSLIALVKLLIYCTEPFRIPFAGKVDICCFDKTGTLTSDDLVVEGVAGIENSDDPIQLSQIDNHSPVKHVLLTCHALANLDGEIIGDPLEKATLNALDWNITKGDTVIPNKGRSGRWQIVQRFHFLSALKRMSVIAGQNASSSSSDMTYIAAVKGAPETLKSMFSQIPDRYDEIYLRLSRQGARVLALGYRSLGVLSNQQLREQYATRASVECNLNFCGFVVLSCPLKPDSKAMIHELRHSSHHLTMITGDNPLTACHVAKELRFTKKKLLVLTEPNDESTEWKWESVNRDINLPIQPANIRDLTKDYALCVTGEGLAHLSNLPVRFLNALMPHIKVFARVSPKQKEQVVIKLNNLGFTTLMCGDGTNDVAALKHAHVGVALLTGVAAKHAEQEAIPSTVQPPAVTTVNPQQQPVTPAEAAQRAREQAKKRIEELYKQMDENEQTIVRLGDASIAAPFTSRTSTIQCVCHIIKQGRCTLVTTLQMFKILALNALILAYSLSVLYLDGIKFSDGQHTLQGLLLAGCFLFISRSKPLKTLARERPLPNIFNFYTLLSVLGQFAVHLTALIYVVNEAHKRIPPRTDEFADLEAEFAPNLVNSTVYIMSITLQIATFAVNYQGYPFMESLRSNKPLLYSIFFSFSLVLSLIFNLMPQLTEQFQIVLIPDDMRLIVFCVVMGDVVLAYLIDRVLAYFLGQAKLKQY